MGRSDVEPPLYPRMDKKETAAHNSKAMIAMTVNAVLLAKQPSPAHITAVSTTDKSAKNSPIAAMALKMPLVNKKHLGNSAHRAINQRIMVIKPAIQASHQLARERIKATTDKTVGRIASLLSSRKHT